MARARGWTVKLAALMSSADTSWRTPDVVLDLVRQVGPIELDPCGHQESLVRARRELRITRGDDGLTADWMALSGGGLVFCNPPFGREIGAWVLRCHALGRAGGEAIALLPSRTDTAWWHAYVAPPASQAVCFQRGRITFVGAPGPAPFPTAFAFFGSPARANRFAEVFTTVGAIWR